MSEPSEETPEEHDAIAALFAGCEALRASAERPLREPED